MAIYAQTLTLLNLVLVKFMFSDHNSAPSRSQETILRQILPIITPDLPIPSRSLNSIIRPEFFNSKFTYNIAAAGGGRSGVAKFEYGYDVY